LSTSYFLSKKLFDKSWGTNLTHSDKRSSNSTQRSIPKHHHVREHSKCKAPLAPSLAAAKKETILDRR